jgi:hypothetical protein
VAPENKTSFGRYLLDSWYVGTSTKHYRCQRVFIKDTKVEWASNNILFKDKEITQPSVTVVNAIVNAATNLAEALKENIHKFGNVSMKDLE